MRHDHLDGLEDRIHGAVTDSGLGAGLTIDFERDRRLLRAAGAGHDFQRHNLDPVRLGRDLLVDQCLDVLVEHQLLLVGQVLEAAEGVLEGVVAEFIAQLLQLVLEGVTSLDEVSRVVDLTERLD